MKEGMRLSRIKSSPSASRAAGWPLRENLAEDGIIFIFVDVVDSDMSAGISWVTADGVDGHAVGDYLVGGIYVVDQDRMDRHSPGNYVPSHDASFHSCA